MIIRVMNGQGGGRQRSASGAVVVMIQRVGEAAGKFLFAEDGSALGAVDDSFPHVSLLELPPS